jgi:hypothetical protein
MLSKSEKLSSWRKKIKREEANRLLKDKNDSWRKKAQSKVYKNNHIKVQRKQSRRKKIF